MEGVESIGVLRRTNAHVQPEVVDLVDEEVEGDDIKILKHVTIVTLEDSDSEDEDDIFVEEILGVRRIHSNDNEVEKIQSTSCSGGDECEKSGEGVGEGMRRRYSQVVMAGPPSTSGKVIEGEEPSTSQEAVWTDYPKDWPPLQPLSETASSSTFSSRASFPSSPAKEVDNEVDKLIGLAKDIDLGGKEVADEILTTGNSSAAPLNNEKASTVEGQEEVDLGGEEEVTIVNLEVLDLEEKETTPEVVSKPNNLGEKETGLNKDLSEVVINFEIEQDPRYKYKGPSWDTQEDIDEFCTLLNAALDSITEAANEKKEAKKQTRNKKKEEQKKARERALAKRKENVRSKRTRVTSTPPVYGCKKKEVSVLRRKTRPLPPPLVDFTKKPTKRKAADPEIPDDKAREIMMPPPLTRRPSSSNITSKKSTSPPKKPQPPSTPPESRVGWVEGDNWEIEEIVDAKLEKTAEGKKRYCYRVKWKEWDTSHNSWVNKSDLSSEFPVRVFWRRWKKKVRKLNLQIKKLAVRATTRATPTYIFG